MKTILKSFFFILMLMWATTLFASEHDGLVLHYSFDTDEGGIVTDLSGESNTGVVHGATFSSDGKFGGAYHFNGNQYILAGDVGYYEVGTISFWMKADEVKNWHNPFSTDYASWDDNIRFEVSTSGEFNGGGHGMGRGGEFTRSMNANEWYHVVYKWDEDFTYGYLNGDLKFKNPYPDPDSYVHPNITYMTAGQFKNITLDFKNVAIGNGYSTAGERYWKGFIDEVRIYNRPVVEQEIQNLYKGRDDGLLVHYSFDEDESGTVTDLSGNGNNGIVNGASFSSEGKEGGAYHFDGIDDHILGGDLGFVEEGTISFWMKADVVEDNRHPFSTDYASWDDNIHFREDTDGSFVVGALGMGASAVYTTALQPDQWYHVVFIWDAENTHGYLDGEHIFTQPLPDPEEPVHPNIPNNAGYWWEQSRYFKNIALGNSYSETPNRYWKGFLDEFKIYNKPLSGDEVKELYNEISLGLVFQDFEPNNGSDSYGWGIQSTAQLSTEQVHSGAKSWKMVSTGNMGGVGIQSQVQRWHLDLEDDRHDRLTFWIWADPSNGLPNTVGVKFFDHNNYVWDPANGKDGFFLWTTKAAEVMEWTQLSVLLTQLPSDFDFTDVDKIEVYHYHDGTYYIDDIQVTLDDRIYQVFEPWSCPSGNPGECGWAWNGSFDLVTSGVYEGLQSWYLNATDYWAGIGVKSQEKRCFPVDTCATQDFWHVDLNPLALVPQQFDRLTFWVKQLGENGLNNNLNVQFFDHTNYFTTPETLWTEKYAQYNQWEHMSVDLKDLNNSFTLEDVNKLQLQAYWKGEYYFDDIRATKGDPIVIDPDALSSGVVTWQPIVGASTYTLQESISGEQGPWATIYQGDQLSYLNNRLSESWIRVRWETAENSNNLLVPYYSDWSEVIHYQPKPVLLQSARLEQGLIEWTFLPQSSLYEVEEADTKNGPWTQIYKGGYDIYPLYSSVNKWYRVRAIIEDENSVIIDSTEWSPVLTTDPNVFIKANGANLRELNGMGDVITLRGFNLGNYFLIEPWMLLGIDSQNLVADDYTIREKLGANAQEVLDVYHNAYIQESDFDHIMRMGANVVRLPFYYKIIRDLDENGDWIGQSFDFSKLDRIVQYAADRGIYVLLDLHGAPGAQSKEFHSGRRSDELPGGDFYHQLFDPNDSTYRDRTVELWHAIASHYKDNPTIVGYDLINEPFGVGDPVYYPDINDGYAALWSLYDEIYDVIRDDVSVGGVGDNNHLIVMEGVPGDNDWDTLPDPQDFGWVNVLYQYHFYCFPSFCGASDPVAHQQFIDQKIAEALPNQEDYDVPLLIGEFNQFDHKLNWEYALSEYNNAGFSWMIWSYKTHDYNSQWGLYNHAKYNESLPDFDNDSISDLKRKLKKYKTSFYHLLNASLLQIIEPLLNTPPQEAASGGGGGAFGGIQVILGPQEAVNNGAKWRLKNGPDTSWKESGEILQVPYGNYKVKFKRIDGFDKPRRKCVSIDDVEVVNITQNYE